MLDNSTYEELVQRYKNGIPCPDDFSFPTHVIDKWSKSDPTLLAIHWVAADFRLERKVTYAELSDESHRMAVAFAKKGIKKGSRVMIVLPKVVEWWVAVFALMRIGAVPIPGTSLLVGSGTFLRF